MYSSKIARKVAISGLVLGCVGGVFAAVTSSQAPASEQPFVAGTPLDHGANVRTYGGFRYAESVSYDPEKDLYVVVNRGNSRTLEPNDGFVALMNPDGTIHTLKWIGATRDGLTLNDPLGSDIVSGKLYVADVDSVRWFDMKTGQPLGNVQVPGATSFNDVEVTEDGAIYATQTGSEASDSWRVYEITPQGQSSILIQGSPLNRPNGVAFDPEGNLVVVNIGSRDVLTFSREGRLIGTEQSVDAGNDGIIVLPDGTKYISSVRQGTVARMRPGQPAERIASGIPNAASMAHDAKRNRLLIPMNPWDAVTILELE